MTAVVDKPPLPLSAARVAAPSSEEIGAKMRILIERFTKLSINRSWVNIDQVSFWRILVSNSNKSPFNAIWNFLAVPAS